MVGKVAGENVIGAPPKEEKGAEEKGCGKTVVYAPYSVGPSLNPGVSLILGIRPLGGSHKLSSESSQLDHCTVSCFYLLRTELVDEP